MSAASQVALETAKSRSSQRVSDGEVVEPDDFVMSERDTVYYGSRDPSIVPVEWYRLPAMYTS